MLKKYPSVESWTYCAELLWNIFNQVAPKFCINLLNLRYKFYRKLFWKVHCSLSLFDAKFFEVL